MAKKKGFFGTVGRLLGSIPVVGKAKKAGKAVKKKVKAVKKKAKKTVKKVKKKLKKKVGKVFTKARKLKNNLSKSKLVKKVKRTVKKVVVKTKKVVKKAKSKAKAVVKSAKQKTKKAVQQVKQTAKKTVQQTKQQLKTVVKETKKAAAKVGGKVAAAYTSFKAGGYKETLSVVADCIPIVGNAKSAYEAISGKDPFTGRKLEEWERTVAAAAVLGGPAVKVVKHGGKLVGGVVKNTSPAIAKNVEKLTNALEQIQLSAASPRPTVQLAVVSSTGQQVNRKFNQKSVVNDSDKGTFIDRLQKPQDSSNALGKLPKKQDLVYSSKQEKKTERTSARSEKGNTEVNEINLRNIEGFIAGNKKFNEVVEDYAQIYKEHIDSNKPWSWDDNILGGDSLTSAQKRKIKEMAIEKGHIPKIKVKKVEGMRYGFADFASANVVEVTVQLPKELWTSTDKEQFKWLDKKIGGKRTGTTWHHTEVPGRMELVPFGIHNITPHNGGRTKGMWADAKR